MSGRPGEPIWVEAVTTATAIELDADGNGRHGLHYFEALPIVSSSSAGFDEIAEKITDDPDQRVKVRNSLSSDVAVGDRFLIVIDQLGIGHLATSQAGTSISVGIFRVTTDIDKRSGTQLGKQHCERWEIIGEQIQDTGETADVYNLWHDPVRRFLLPADGRPLGVNEDNFVLAIQIGTLWIALPPVYPLSYVNVGVAMEVNQGMLGLQMNALLVPRADNDFANEIHLEDCP